MAIHLVVGADVAIAVGCNAKNHIWQSRQDRFLNRWEQLIRQSIEGRFVLRRTGAWYRLIALIKQGLFGDAPSLQCGLQRLAHLRRHANGHLNIGGVSGLHTAGGDDFHQTLGHTQHRLAALECATQGIPRGPHLGIHVVNQGLQHFRGRSTLLRRLIDTTNSLLHTGERIKKSGAMHLNRRLLLGQLRGQHLDALVQLRHGAHDGLGAGFHLRGQVLHRIGDHRKTCSGDTRTLGFNGCIESHQTGLECNACDVSGRTRHILQGRYHFRNFAPYFGHAVTGLAHR